MRDSKRSRFFSGGGIGDMRSGRLRRKFADNGGLTMIEMLCVLIILTLLCMMLTTSLSMASHHYRMLTAEAETELLVDTIVSSLTDKLRGSTLKVDGSGHYSHDMGAVGIAGNSRAHAGIAEGEPAQGTVVIGQDALLPDGAYGAVFSMDDTNGKKRRYEVTYLSVSVADASGTEWGLPPADGTAGAPAVGDAVTYTIKVTVKDRVTDITRSTPDGGIAVRCLNPVKQS